MKTLLTAILVSLSLNAISDTNRVIYGVDNRKDIYESTDSTLVELSRSTAAMIEPTQLKTSNKQVTISGETLQERGICAKERFSKQISAANCSGFLVAPDVLVTAGHCIANMSDCSTYKWVFDYKMDHAGQKEITVPTSSVYSCKKIIERKLSNFLYKVDYAVIQLDRASDRRPLSFRKSGTLSVGDKLAVIGHPTGLPSKIADGGIVRKLKPTYFIASLDTYGGNSGSAVFNTATSEVEGILVRGQTDYVTNGSCMVSNVCSETDLSKACKGEDVSMITKIDALKNL